MRPPVGCALALVIALAGAPMATIAASPAYCPQSTGEGGDPLPHLADKLKQGATLDVLAVGVGPMQPVAASPGSPSAGFLSHLAHALESIVQGLHVNVTPRGGGGVGASTQVQIIQAALAKHRYPLVLWQTGTLEAVQGGPTDVFYQALADGADLAGTAGADLVLVEPQYSRFLADNANPAPYLSAMQAIGAEPGIVLFRRYELMRDWEDAGLIDLEHATKSDRPAVAARLHACLAAELARALLAGAAAARDAH